MHVSISSSFTCIAAMSVHEVCARVMCQFSNYSVGSCLLCFGEAPRNSALKLDRWDVNRCIESFSQGQAQTQSMKKLGHTCINRNRGILPSWMTTDNHIVA